MRRHMETKRTLKAAFATLGAAALIVTAAGAALAEGNGTNQNNYNKLKEFVYESDPYGDPADCSTASWQDVGNNGDDSPIDSNDRALVAEVCDTEFGEAYSSHSLNVKTMISRIRNISFDYQTDTVTGAGQVYILLVLADGNYLFLDPAHCSRPIGSGFWSRADFTGTTALDACTVYDVNSVPYTSDGTHNALQVYALTNGDTSVSIADFGFFDYPGADPSHTYVFDRIALGTNRLYNYSNTRAFGCSYNESRC
jgi:hypothetical protein